jgi:DNA-binding YbaB/EbfC family protein
MSKGFKGFPSNMQGLMKQAQKMQEELQRANIAAESLTAESSAGGGAVRVLAKGSMRIESIFISPELLQSGDCEMIQDALLLAVNEALSEIQKKKEEKISAITGGASIPGLT